MRTRSIQLSGIAAFLSAVLAAQAAGGGSSELDAARAELDLAVAQVRGQGVPEKEMFDAGKMRPVSDALEELIQMEGIGVAANLLLSSEEDDYALQAAATALVVYDRYDTSDLGILCKVFLKDHFRGDGGYVSMQNRARVDAETFYYRTSQWIAVLLGIPPGADIDVETEFSPDTSASDPAGWLKTLVQSATDAGTIGVDDIPKECRP